MRKTMMIAIAALALSACAVTDDQKISDMKRPIIITGVTQETDQKLGMVMITDADGNTLTMSSNSSCGLALLGSYKAGDTLGKPSGRTATETDTTKTKEEE